MIAEPADPGPLVEELLVLLDEQIVLLERRRGELEALSRALIARDDAAMEKLLVRMEITIGEQHSADLRLRAVRNALASALACPPEEVRLRALIQRLPGERRDALEQRRRQIVLLADRLRREHLQTCLFLMESARINRMLLESLFPGSDPVVTYGGDGTDHWRPPTPLVDAEM